jgi:hypothetical protein
MKNSKKLSQTNVLCPTLLGMRERLGLAIIAAIIFSAIICVPNARAQGKMSQDNTALSNTTISGGDILTLMDSSVFAPPVPEPSTLGQFGLPTLSPLNIPDNSYGVIAVQPLLPESDLFPPSGTSAFDLQPVPEPSTFTLGGLAIGLIAVSCKKRVEKVFTFFG